MVELLAFRKKRSKYFDSVSPVWCGIGCYLIFSVDENVGPTGLLILHADGNYIGFDPMHRLVENIKSFFFVRSQIKMK